MLLEQVSTIMSCTPLLHIPACFHTWTDSHVIVLGSSLYCFTYQDACFHMKNRSNTYPPHGEFSPFLIWYTVIFGEAVSILWIPMLHTYMETSQETVMSVALVQAPPMPSQFVCSEPCPLNPLRILQFGFFYTWDCDIMWPILHPEE